MDAGEYTPDSRTAESLPVLRGRLQGRMPHWFGKVHTLFEVANEIGHRLSSIFLRDEAASAPSMVEQEVQEDPPLEGLHSVLRYSSRQRAGLGGEPSNRLDWRHRAPRLMFAAINPSMHYKGKSDVVSR